MLPIRRAPFPKSDTVPAQLAVLPFTLVNARLISEFSAPVLLAVFPFALVSAAVRIHKNATSVKVAVPKLALVSVAVRPHINTAPVLLAVPKLALVSDAVRPHTLRLSVGSRSAQGSVPRIDSPTGTVVMFTVRY